MKPNTTRESGFTLLELLLVIGVAALLLIGGIVTYRLVSDGNKTTETTRLLLTIRQESNVLAQQQGGAYTGIAFDSAASDPASPLVTGGVLRDTQRNAFNGGIVIAPATGTATDDQLSVSFANVSQSACGKLMLAINNPNELVEVAVNGGTPRTPPVTVADTAADCNAASNTIVWLFP